MAQEGQVSDLTTLLSSFSVFITYEPLRTEVPCSVFLPANARTYTIPPRASLDPHVVADEVRPFTQDLVPALLIPGRRFDAAGTRHGQGGGWYDRFLAAVPREWLRIGICYDDQFSPAPLVRESWDQAMDYVAVVNRESGEVTLYSTDAPHD